MDWTEQIARDGRDGEPKKRVREIFAQKRIL
jgi:hypothetical protein